MSHVIPPESSFRISTPTSTIPFRRLSGLIALLLAVPLPAGAAVPRTTVLPVVTAGHSTGEIQLDGRLDEEAWQHAGIISDLTQQDPHPGEPTPFKTEIRVLVDQENLYFGVYCHDPDPQAIAIHTMSRDGNLWGDDNIAFVLDTFGDQRTGYFFRTNAAGARQDGLISNSEDSSTNWDGIWDVRTRRVKDGWTAEFVIPSQTLRFTRGLDQWGFNVERRIARSRMSLRWTGITLDSRLNDFRRAGRLAGVGGLRQGIGLSVSPYGLVRGEGGVNGVDRVTTGDVGGDVTWNLSSNLTGVVTVNTDFAETDVDTRQINLTRFPLFFPEKRAFFLEGSSLFSFGTGLRTDFIAFFSRRIGLYQGDEIPINAGLKVLGRAGRWNIGALDTFMGSSEATRSTNLFAGRVTYDVDDHLTVGLIATNGDPSGKADNSLLGVDAQWRTSTFHGDKNLAFGAWGSFTSSSDVPGRPAGWGLKLDYPNDLWDLFLIYKQFGREMDPALGFLPRPGTRWVQGGGAFQPRPNVPALSWIRQWFFETFVTWVENLDGHTESWRLFTAPINIELESGEHIESNWVPQYESLDEDFEIADGVVIPAGDYDFTRFRVEAQSARSRPWRIGSTVWFGEFYTGHLTQIEAFANATIGSGHLRLELSGELDEGSLPEGDFTERLYVLDTTYAFNPDLLLSLNLQYDSPSRTLGANTRLRWTLEPGKDLYIVWNRGWRRSDPSARSDFLRPVDDQLVVKLRWTFRA